MGKIKIGDIVISKSPVHTKLKPTPTFKILDDRHNLVRNSYFKVKVLIEYSMSSIVREVGDVVYIEKKYVYLPLSRILKNL